MLKFKFQRKITVIILVFCLIIILSYYLGLSRLTTRYITIFTNPIIATANYTAAALSDFLAVYLARADLSKKNDDLNQKLIELAKKNVALETLRQENEWLKKELKLPEKCKVVVQGFGNVGSYAALIWNKAGHDIVGLSDSKNGIYNEKGFDIEKLMKYKKDTGSLSGFSNAKEITNKELLETECDLLIPAAFENQITGTNAEKIKAKAILELANGPIAPEADEILFKKGIPVVPDILANSGGVIVSYFEWVQNLKGEHWSEKEVFDKLQPMLEDSAKKIVEKAKESNTDLRRGAFILALERIEAKTQ